MRTFDLPPACCAITVENRGDSNAKGPSRRSKPVGEPELDSLIGTGTKLGQDILNYNANDQSATDTYDANGNTTASIGQRHVYDFENHLIKVG